MFDQSTHLFNQYAKKKLVENLYMDGWMKLPKTEKNSIYLWSAVYQHKNSPWVRYLHAADVRYIF